jgi:hypothetical protein
MEAETHAALGILFSGFKEANGYVGRDLGSAVEDVDPTMTSPTTDSNRDRARRRAIAKRIAH